MTDITCPLCGKPNPPERDECQFCQAPLKTSGFLAPSETEGQEEQPLPPPIPPGGRKGKTTSSLEQAIPDWLKETEASFLGSSDVEPAEPQETTGPTSDEISEQIDSLLNQPPPPPPEKEPTIDDDWLASLLEEAGLNQPEPTTAEEGLPQAEAEVGEPPAQEQVEKPEWLSELEAGSKIKLEEQPQPPAEEPARKITGPLETGGEEAPLEQEIPDWVGKTAPEESAPAVEKPEPTIAPAELPGWLEALRPSEEAAPTGPVEDLSAADMVTAGPLVGLRGVISAHPSAIRARKPPTYSIKLRVTDEQRSRMEMMEELLANEQKPKPLPAQHTITSRHIFRLVIAAVLFLPIIWIIITGRQSIPLPQPAEIPGVVDFTQQVQTLPEGAPVLLAFDYEAGFSGEMNTAVSTLISQLMLKNAFMTLVTTTPAGPALAESLINTSLSAASLPQGASFYANLGYIPGGTLGLIGFATSPKTVLPYSLEGDNVWATSPLNSVAEINDFSAVIVMTNEPGIARSWIEQVGPLLKEAGTPMLFVTSAQAEPLIQPYYAAVPSQVQGLVAGLIGGLAYGQMVGSTPESSLWDALSIGITASILIVLTGAIAGAVMNMRTSTEKKEK